MTSGDLDEATAEIAASLKRRATELWGAKRAEALHAVIFETAEDIQRIAQDPPPVEEEPGVFL